MRMGICDDDSRLLGKLRAICEKQLDAMGEKWEIVSFSDGQQVLDYEKELHVLILDMEMPGVDGIAVKNYLAENKMDTLIIYVTSHSELMKEAFGIHVADFVEKKDLEKELPGSLEQALKSVEREVFLEGFSSKDIMYISGEREYIRICLKNGKSCLVRMKLKRAEQELAPASFLQIHRSYLVNMFYITAIDHLTVRLGETQLPISRKKYGEVKNRYRIFSRNQARLA